MKKLLGRLKTSAFIVALVAVLSLLYAWYSRGTLTPAYVFTANFYVGTFLTIAGLLVMLIGPAYQLFRKNDLLEDHTTYGERLMEERANTVARSHELLYIGMLNISITAIAQLILSFIF